MLWIFISLIVVCLISKFFLFHEAVAFLKNKVSFIEERIDFIPCQTCSNNFNNLTLISVWNFLFFFSSSKTSNHRAQWIILLCQVMSLFLLRYLKLSVLYIITTTWSLKGKCLEYLCCYWKINRMVGTSFRSFFMVELYHDFIVVDQNSFLYFFKTLNFMTVYHKCLYICNLLSLNLGDTLTQWKTAGRYYKYVNKSCDEN